MNQTPIEELDFWGSRATLDDVHGVPPYEVGPVADRILANQPDAKRCLDVGCGVGRLTNHIASRLRGVPVYGFDISKRFVSEAVRHAPANAKFWRSDGRTIPYGITGTFDLVWSVTVLQHIPWEDQIGYIGAVADRLVDGGVFAFTVAGGDGLPRPFDFSYDEHGFEFLLQWLSGQFDTTTVDVDDINHWGWITCVK